jgi:hypothetical protein
VCVHLPATPSEVRFQVQIDGICIPHCPASCSLEQLHYYHLHQFLSYLRDKKRCLMDVSSSHNGDQPSQSPTSTDLCERCASMFSTVESLRALVSEDGIECFEWSDIRHSASRGCPLCLEIKEQRIDWILHSGPRFRKDSRLKIVGVDKFSDSDPVGSSDYPHRVLSIRYVAILAYNMSENLFAIYTPQGGFQFCSLFNYGRVHEIAILNLADHNLPILSRYDD